MPRATERDGELDAVRELDARLDAGKCVATWRDASRQMGGQAARIAAASTDDRFVAELARAVAAGETVGHHAVVFGAVTGRGGAEPEAVAAAYLHATTVLLVSAAVRLAPIGQLDGQRALATMRPRIARLARGGGRRRERRGPLEFRAGSRAGRLATRTARDEALPLMIPRPLKIGVGGPVGSGKTALVEALCLRLRDQVDLAVITNDIYTREDAEFLVRRGALPSDRVVGVETGGCPHTAIREDASVNLEAVRQLVARFPALELLLIESGGDNLAATFSPELVDATVYVIDVAEGDKIPRKGGPGSRAPISSSSTRSTSPPMSAPTST